MHTRQILVHAAAATNGKLIAAPVAVGHPRHEHIVAMEGRLRQVQRSFPKQVEAQP